MSIGSLVFILQFSTSLYSNMSKQDKFNVLSICKKMLICCLFLYMCAIIFLNNSNFLSTSQTRTSSKIVAQTNISHLVFGLLGNERAWHHRKHYVEAWWRPNVTRGHIFLDVPPRGDLLPWSLNSPPYRISDDVRKLVRETNHVDPRVLRMVHGIMEVVRQAHEGVRWVILGDDDTIFFVDNMVDILAQYDHTKYYYFGGHSEFILSNYWYSFHQGFGGAGIILSYPLAREFAHNVMSCLKRYAHLKSSDRTTMVCVADLGVNLTPLQGIHQIDLRGDISGFLSYHPKSLLTSLHHYDTVDPIFPSMTRAQAGSHLLKAAFYDQSRMLQQTICHHRSKSWTFSVSWGYSAHIYEKIMPRSWIQRPIVTFRTWQRSSSQPQYMFDVRGPSWNPCEAPHVFFFKSVEKTQRGEIITTYSRGWPRGIGACLSSGNFSAEYVSEIYVYSPAIKRIQIDKCECCDVIHEEGSIKADIKYRECKINELIA